MSEIETEVLDDFIKTLSEKGVGEELLNALSPEISSETPNAEKIAQIIKLNRAASDD